MNRPVQPLHACESLARRPATPPFCPYGDRAARRRRSLARIVQCRSTGLPLSQADGAARPVADQATFNSRHPAILVLLLTQSRLASCRTRDATRGTFVLSNGAVAVHLETGKTVRVAAHAPWNSPLLDSRQPSLTSSRWNAPSPTGYPGHQRRNNGRSSRGRSIPRNAAGIRTSRRFDR